MQEKPKTLTLTALSIYLGIKKRTLYVMIKDGRFSVQHIKGSNPKLWNISDVDEWKTQK